MYVPVSPLSSTTQYIVSAPPTAPTPEYNRTPPKNITEYPKCATYADRTTAHKNCQPIVEVIRGLDALGLLALTTANPCWVETLPLCPPPILKAAPRRVVAPAPAPAPAPTPPKPAVFTPPKLIAAPPRPKAAPVPAPEPVQAGFTTGGLLAVAAAVGIGGWLLFGRKKKQAA